MVSVEKHPNTSLKYPGPTVMHLPPGDTELEAPLCQTCLGDHSFPRGVMSQETESCSWESQPSSKVSKAFFLFMFLTKTGAAQGQRAMI